MDVDFTRALAEKRKALFLQRQDFFSPRQAQSRKNPRQNSCRVDNQTSLLGQFSLSHNLLWHISARGIIRRCRFGNGAAQKYNSECFRSGARQRLFASTAFRARRRFGVQCRKLFSCPRSRIPEGGRLRRNPYDERRNAENRPSLFPDISGRFLKAITQFISVAVLSQTSTFSPTEVCCQIVALANWSITNRAGVIWRGNLNFMA